MKFLSVSIQGFKSFGKNQTFVFPDESGLYFLTGLNEVEPDLEANAAGKSTLWDAITWCFYGKTPRNAKANDIKNWYSDEKVVVSTQFDEKGEKHVLTRTWSPNSLVLDGENITQESLLGIIKLDFDHFLYSILFSQFRNQFFDLSQSEKTSLFTQILNLEEWDGYSKRASQQVSHLQGIENDLKMDVAHMKGNKQALSEINFDEKIEAWNKKQKERVKELELEILTIKNDMEEIREGSLELVEENKKLEKAGEKDIAKLQVLKDQMKEALKEEKQLNSEILDIKTDIGIYKAQIQKFEKLGTTCPTCEQEVNPAHIEKEIKSIRRKLKKLDVEYTDLFAVQEELLSIKADIKEDIDAVADRKNARDVLLSKVASQVATNKREVSKLMTTLNQRILKQEEVSAESNPVLEEKKSNESKIRHLTKDIMEKSAEMLKLAGTIEQTVYWVKAFKNIRLFLISEVLTQLEIEVNNCLFRLGLRDWKIEFDIDKENKSGTVRKGFTILIYSPYNVEPVSWESWSGGETQRLKLAGTVGLSNLILARCGVESYVEAWDEPTNWLSSKGVDQLLETLEARSQELNKQVWLIDHRSLDSGCFTGMYSVNKNSKGSYFTTL